MLVYFTNCHCGFLWRTLPGENLMSLPNLRKNLRRLPKLGALALGFGGLLAADAPAEKSEFQSLGTGARSNQQLDLARHAVVMRLHGERIFISQHGGPFEELSLGDTQQAAYLRELLRDAGAAEGPVSVPVGSMVVANGGGAADGKKPVADETKPKEPDTSTGSEKKQPDKKAKQPPPNNSGSGK
jgi:hypothetical protein